MTYIAARPAAAFALLALALAASPAHAAPAGPKPPQASSVPGYHPVATPSERPTVQQESLVERAMTNVPQIVAANRTLKANEERLAAARGGYLPSIAINGQLSSSNSANPAAGVTAPVTVTSGTAGIHQEIYNFGRTAAQVDAASANAEASRGALRDQAVEVAHQVRRAYVTWVQARGLETQARAQLLDDQHVYDQTVAFFKAGVRARLDVTRAKVTLEQTRAALLAAHTSADQARAQLATAIGEREPLTGVPGFAAVPPIAQVPLDRLQALAMQSHPLLATSQAQVASARAARKSAQAADLPDLGADASYGARARDLDLGPSWSVALGLSWPLYNGGAYEHLKEATRLQEEAAEANLRAQEDQVLLAVRDALLAVEGARVRLPATDAELASARENLFQANGRYQAGVGSIIEVSDAQNLLATAQADQLRAQATYHLAIADLIAAAGLTGLEPQGSLSTRPTPTPTGAPR